MGFANGWCPCDKITCGNMWEDIYALTCEASKPWNLSLVSIYATYFGYLTTGKNYTPTINETLKVS